MTNQVLRYPSNSYSTDRIGGDSVKKWQINAGIDIDGDLTPPGKSLGLYNVVVWSNGIISITIRRPGSVANSDDLSDAWEATGSVTFIQGANSLKLKPSSIGSNPGDPYSWPAGTATNFYNAISSGQLYVVLEDGTTKVQTLILSSAYYRARMSSNIRARKQWIIPSTDRITIIDDLTPSGTSREVAALSFYDIGSGTLDFRDPNDFTLPANTDLSDAWEATGSVTFIQDSNSLKLKPSSIPDTTDPYSWPVGTATSFYNIITRGNILVVLDDNTSSGTPLSLSAYAGQPTAAFDLNSSTPLSLSARAGNPTASLNLAHSGLSLSARAGQPIASFALSTDINILELEAYTLVAGLNGLRQPVGDTIPEDLIIGGNPTRRITSFLPFTNSRIYFQLDSGDPEFTDIIERSAVFDIVNPSGDIVLTLNGLKDEPGSRDTDTDPDYTNPYNIDLADSRASTLKGQLATLFTGTEIPDVTGWQLRIVIPRTILAEDLSLYAKAGLPTASFDLTAYNPAVLALSAKAGQPTTSFNLKYTPPVQNLSLSVSAGNPTASFTLEYTPPTSGLSLSAKAGQPTTSFNLKYTPPTSGLSLSAKAGSPTAAFDLTRDLQLSDFNARGLEVEFIGLLRASNAGTIGNIIYATPQRGGTSSPIDGDILINNDGTAITRILHVAGGLGLNDNTSLSLSTYFGTNGDGNDLTLHIQTATAKTSIVIKTSILSIGGGYANFVLTSAARIVLNSIKRGELFLFAATRPLPAGSVSVSAKAGLPTASFDLTADNPAVLALSAKAGQPTTSFDLTADNPAVLALSAKAGQPTTSFNLKYTPPTSGLSLSAKAGQPTTSFDLTNIPSLSISVSASAGQPTAAFNLTADNPFLALALSARAGLPTAAFDLTRDLQLSDFNARGLEVEFIGLIRASDVERNGRTIYATSARGGSDSPIDGDLLINNDGTPITRIRRSPSSLLINDNSSLALSTYFRINGDGNDLTLHIQTNAGKASLVVADTLGSAGGGYINFTFSSTFAAILNGINSGDLFLFAATRPLPAEDLAFSARAGLPTASFALLVDYAENLALSAKAGLPTASFNLTADNPAVLALSAKAGLPTASFNLTADNPAVLALSAKAGLPTASFNLTADNPAVLALSAKAGLPTAAFNLIYIPPDQELRLSARAGQPTASFDLDLIKSYKGEWPSYLPSLFEASGYTDEFAEQVFHSAIEKYDNVSRRGARRENKANLQGVILMNAFQWDRLKKWYTREQGYGALPFLFPDPDIITKQIKVGFAKPPVVSSAGYDLYRVRLTLEQK